MKADEIVRALRAAAAKWEAKNKFIGTGELRVHDALNDAADLIKSLQAEITQLKDELADYNCDTKIGCKLIEEVKAERDAAVAENERLAKHGGKYIQLSDERYKMYEKAVKRAEDAEIKLAESQRREKGCEHCRGWDSRCGASYCPMCGKRLPVYAGTIGGEIVKNAMREVEP